MDRLQKSTQYPQTSTAKWTRKVKLLFAVTIILYSLTSLTYIATSFLARDVINSAVYDHLKNFGLYCGLSVATILTSYLFSVLAKKYELLYIQENLLYNKQKLYHQLILDPLNDKQVDYSGLSTDLELLAVNHFTSKLMMAKYAISFFIGLVALVVMSWVLALVVIVVSAIPMLLPKLTESHLQKRNNEYSTSSNHYLSYVIDSLRGREEIQNYKKVNQYTANHSTANQRMESARARLKFDTFLAAKAAYSISDGAYLAVTAIGAFMTAQGWITVGLLIAVPQLMTYIVDPMGQFAGEWTTYNSSLELKKKYDLIPDVANLPVEISQFTHALTLESITFSFSNERSIIEKLSQNIYPGDRLAIIGESGRGKTTLLKLIAGQLEPSRGAVCLDGAHPAQHKDAFRIVLQNSHIFDDTLRNNLTLYSSIPDEMILSVLTRVQLQHLANIELLEKGIRDLGNLSGGEKQRLVLARAILSGVEQKILLLDEPTANLDINTTKRLMDYLMKLDTTIIMVTHNNELLPYFDKVIQL